MLHDFLSLHQTILSLVSGCTAFGYPQSIKDDEERVLSGQHVVLWLGKVQVSVSHCSAYALCR